MRRKKTITASHAGTPSHIVVCPAKRASNNRHEEEENNNSEPCWNTFPHSSLSSEESFQSNSKGESKDSKREDTSCPEECVLCTVTWFFI